MTGWRVVCLLVVVACKSSQSPAPAHEWIRVGFVDPALDAQAADQAVQLIEHEAQSLPHVTRTVGMSEAGQSVVRIDVDSEIEKTRTALHERLATRLRAFPSISVEQDFEVLGSYVVRSSQRTVVEARDWQDRTAALQFLQLPGVTGVVACGGATDARFEIRIDPARLAAYGLTASDVVDGVRRAPDDPQQACALPLGHNPAMPVRVADVATCAAAPRPQGCRAFDKSGEVVSVVVYGNADARGPVRAQIAALAEPTLEIVSAPSGARMLLAIPLEKVSTVMARLDGAVARFGIPGWLPGDVLLDVAADRAAAVREQLARTGLSVADPEGTVAWLTGNDISELAAVGTGVAVELGTAAPETVSDRWLEFDNARIGKLGAALTEEQRRDLSALVGDRVRVGRSGVLRIGGGELDIGALVVAYANAAPVRLADVAHTTSAVMTRQIWRLNGFAAIAVRPLPSSPRAVLDRLAHDKRARFEPMVHIR